MAEQAQASSKAGIVLPQYTRVGYCAGCRADVYVAKTEGGDWPLMSACEPGHVIEIVVTKEPKTYGKS